MSKEGFINNYIDVIFCLRSNLIMSLFLNEAPRQKDTKLTQSFSRYPSFLVCLSDVPSWDCAVVYPALESWMSEHPTIVTRTPVFCSCRVLLFVCAGSLSHCSGLLGHLKKLDWQVKMTAFSLRSYCVSTLSGWTMSAVSVNLRLEVSLSMVSAF